MKLPPLDVETPKSPLPLMGRVGRGDFRDPRGRFPSSARLGRSLQSRIAFTPGPGRCVDSLAGIPVPARAVPCSCSPAKAGVQSQSERVWAPASAGERNPFAPPRLCVKNHFPTWISFAPSSQMNDSPTPQPTAIPVICDRCRAEGMAGDEAFAAIPDILEFEPVPRRARADGWTPEHQRAFIAALAITGSPRQAARHVGRAAFGAEQLRTAKGGRSFAAAWDAAMDLARDKELARLHDNLGDLAKKTEEENAQAKASGRPVAGDDDYGEENSYQREAEEARARIFDRLQKMRRNILREEIIPDPEKRAAWIVLNGPEEIEAIENGTWTSPTWEELKSREGENTDTPTSSSSAPIGDPASPAKQPSSSSPSPTPPEKPGPRIRSL